MLKIHYFQHVPFEGLGSIATWAQNAGHQISVTRFYAGEHPPPVNLIDWLIIMGGPMSVAKEERYPWLAAEKTFINQTIDQGKRVLGICLGAQLIASVLGADVYPNPQREIGWFPVYPTMEASKSPIANHLPNGLNVFHWHGDTFDLPKGAAHLMRSQACENQAFMVGDRILGFQFHLETTLESAAALVKNCADDLRSGPFVQDAETILTGEERFNRINQSMESILEYLAGITDNRGQI
ncbi:MAG: type 1 glutamine amidotransferase [Deltaproteobacteria bacterium]|nr:type 1 glutamine amidotransferase [Deltaproteobacteria bacterium]